MANNILQSRLEPEKPKIISQERIYVYVPKATDNKSEATVLKELLIKISTDRGDKYRQYYYPAASKCYAYQPSVKDDEVLLDKFKAHHWWLPSEGELARMYYYHSHGYDTTKEDAKAIFANANNLGILSQFSASWIWSSTELSATDVWSIEFSNGFIYDGGFGAYSKFTKYPIRPICSF